MKVGIVGGGAMGSLFAALLSHEDVWLYEPVNTAHVQRIQKHGLTLEAADHRERTVQIHATSHAAEIGVCDLVALFVKAPDTPRAMEDAGSLIGSETVVLSLQNGIGVRDLMAKYVPAERLFRGVTSHGATFVEPGRVRHAGVGMTKVAPVSIDTSVESRDRVQSMFRRAGIPLSFESSADRILWEKVIVNAGINALTALMDVPNGKLVEDPELLAILHGAVNEGSAVARAMGCAFDAEKMRVAVESVARATATNISSMRQDVRAGRPTEIDFINGAIVRYAAEHGVAAPVNTLLTRMVRKVSERRGE